MARAKVNWYENDVMLAVEDATDEMLTAIAFQMEALAKVNAPSAPPGFDTGFMRNAIYALGPDESHRDRAEQDARAVADYDMADAPALDPHAAGLHAAAVYTITWEMRYHFIYRAIEQTRADVAAAGTIQEIKRR